MYPCNDLISNIIHHRMVSCPYGLKPVDRQRQTRRASLYLPHFWLKVACTRVLDPPGPKQPDHGLKALSTRIQGIWWKLTGRTDKTTSQNSWLKNLRGKRKFSKGIRIIGLRIFPNDPRISYGLEIGRDHCTVLVLEPPRKPRITPKSKGDPKRPIPAIS